jgi:DNA-binding Xre family transcriptional regulator
MKIKIKSTEQLNELIIIKGFSKTELGKKINLSIPMTVQITNGDRNPSPRTAKRICEVLECEWSDLFEIIKTPKPTK